MTLQEKQKIEDLENRVAILEVLLNELRQGDTFFTKPSIVQMIDKVLSGAQIETGLPGVIAWLRDEFRREGDRERRAFLSKLHAVLQDELLIFDSPLRCDLVEKGKIDLSDIFER